MGCLRGLMSLLVLAFSSASAGHGLDFQSCSLQQREPERYQSNSIQLPEGAPEIARYAQTILSTLTANQPPLVLIAPHPKPNAHHLPPYHPTLNRACPALQPTQATPSMYGCPDDIAALSQQGAIVLSSGLLSLIDSRQELAFVLAHELAHGVLHSDRRRALRGAAGGRQGDSGEEILADQLALELLLESHHSTAGALSILERLRTANRHLEGPLTQRIATLQANATAFARSP